MGDYVLAWGYSFANEILSLSSEKVQNSIVTRNSLLIYYMIVLNYLLVFLFSCFDWAVRDAASAPLGFQAVPMSQLLKGKSSVVAGHFGGLTVVNKVNYRLWESLLSYESLNPLVLLLSADRPFPVK